VIDMCVSVFVCVPMCQYVLKEDIWMPWHVHVSCSTNLYTACSSCSY